MKKTLVLLLVLTLSTNVSCSGEKQTNEKIKTNQSIIKEEGKKMKPINLTKKDFLEKVVNYEENPTEWKYLGDKPAIVDFYADWCGPCKMIAPVLEELADEYKDQLYIYKIDTEQEQELAAVFGIRSIPTLLFIPLEGNPQLVQGALPKASFKEVINDVLLKK